MAIRSKDNISNADNNPWAGLASYEDPETAERKLKFCGRDDDSYDLARLIMGYVFVTLYGKSGIGKTSLLNAGVFPELREEQYTPVSIRLGMRDDEHPQSYQTIIVEAVERVVNRIDSINVIDEQQDQQSIDYLWNYFARHRFYDKHDEPTTPVIVFDQFEEVFRAHRDEAEILLRQLDYLNDKDHTLDSCEVDGQPYRYEQNFRFVVSIREDDLYRLEDSIDNCFLPALKRCRYRLRSLSEKGARDAILIPGEGLFNADEKEAIANVIISKSRNDDGSISTNIISLLCSRIYVDFKKSGTDHITPSLVDFFIKGNPFERFYNEATRGFSNKEKSYIEDNLVDSTGRRNSIPESNFLLYVPKGQQLLEGDTRILQRTSTSNDGGNYQIELIHDSFCEPLSTQKEKREKRKRLIQLAGISGVAITSIAIIAFVVYQMNLAAKANWKMMENQARAVAEKANQLIDEGDLYTAICLCLEVLPDNIESSDKPYVVEVEKALRRADWELLHANNKTIAEIGAPYGYPDYGITPNEKFVWIEKGYPENEIHLYDIESGAFYGKIKCWPSPTSNSFSSDGKYFVTTLCNDEGDHDDVYLTIWDIEKRKIIKKREIDYHRIDRVEYCKYSNYIKIVLLGKDEIIYYNSISLDEVYDISFNGGFEIDENHLFQGSRWNMRLYDIKEGRVVYSFGDYNGYGYPLLSCTDSLFIRMENHSDICVYDILSGKKLAQMDNVVAAPVDEYVIYAQRGSDNAAVIYNVDEGTFAIVIDLSSKAIKATQITKERLSLDLCSYFFSDDNNLLINFADKTIYEVNINNNNVKETTLSSYYPSHSYLIKQKDRMPTLQLIRLNNDIKVERYETIGDIYQYADGGETMYYTIQGIRYEIRDYYDTHDDYRKIVIHTNGDVYLYDERLKKHRFVYSFNNMEKKSWWNICVNKKCNSFAISTNDSVYIMSLDNLNCIKNFKTQNIDYSQCVFSSDGNFIYIGNDSVSYIYNTISGKQVSRLEGHPCFNITFSPLDTYLACTLNLDEDAALAMFDVSTGKHLWTSKDICLNRGSSNPYVKFSHDGKIVACVNNDLERGIMVFEVLSGRVIATLKHHTEEICSIDFNSNDNYLVSSARDGDVCLWNIKEQQVVQVFHPFSGGDADVEFTSDNYIRVRLKYEFGDTHIIEYPFFTLKEVVKRNKIRFKDRTLTPEELRKYYLE